MHCAALKWLRACVRQLAGVLERRHTARMRGPGAGALGTPPGRSPPPSAPATPGDAPAPPQAPDQAREHAAAPPAAAAMPSDFAALTGAPGPGAGAAAPADGADADFGAALALVEALWAPGAASYAPDAAGALLELLFRRARRPSRCAPGLPPA